MFSAEIAKAFSKSDTTIAATLPTEFKTVSNTFLKPESSTTESTPASASTKITRAVSTREPFTHKTITERSPIHSRSIQTCIPATSAAAARKPVRSEERRVGKEGGGGGTQA